MIYVVFFVYIIHVSILQAYPDPQSTTVQIHNHEGPIYIHPQHDLISIDQSPLLHNSQTPCQISETPYQNSQTPCQNSQIVCQNSQTSCQNSQTPYLNSQTPCQNSQIVCQNSQTPSQISQTPYYNSPSPCQDSPLECTCVTKHQSNCIPINCVPQSQCCGTYKYSDSGCNGDSLHPQVFGDVVLTYGTQNMCAPQNHCHYGYLYGYY